ncbi:hypothetical protein LVD15_04170 [Fulvivirga maritima]|uniref:hypothetical protein n=1 Tax=Fulvivirga maritima TaxID=2904247 RepID=UPI001F27A22C|nr:hypothetical protein [Fulvivirga maritima]UII27630.1 hypothetical protein LVD15_04170 [Fulvivirga maritima]
MKKTLLTISIACLFIFTARSQNIGTYFQSVRTGTYPQIPSAFFSGDMSLMNQLTPYYKDSIDDLRPWYANHQSDYGILDEGY